MTSLEKVLSIRESLIIYYLFYVILRDYGSFTPTQHPKSTVHVFTICCQSCARHPQTPHPIYYTLPSTHEKKKEAWPIGRCADADIWRLYFHRIYWIYLACALSVSNSHLPLPQVRPCHIYKIRCIVCVYCLYIYFFFIHSPPAFISDNFVAFTPPITV